MARLSSNGNGRCRRSSSWATRHCTDGAHGQVRCRDLRAARASRQRSEISRAPSISRPEIRSQVLPPPASSHSAVSAFPETERSPDLLRHTLLLLAVLLFALPRRPVLPGHAAALRISPRLAHPPLVSVYAPARLLISFPFRTDVLTFQTDVRRPGSCDPGLPLLVPPETASPI